MKDNIKVTIYFSMFVLFLVFAFGGYSILSKNKADNSDIQKNNIVNEYNEEKIKIKDFKLTLENGEKILFSELLTGKPIIINIWTSWCTYCDIEMEYFNEFYNKEKDNVTFVMINATGDRDSKEKAQEYIKTRGYLFEIYYDLELEAIINLGVYSYPTTIFIDKDGYIDSKVIGTISRETLKKKIEKLK